MRTFHDWWEYGEYFAVGIFLWLGNTMFIQPQSDLKKLGWIVAINATIAIMIRFLNPDMMPIPLLSSAAILSVMFFKASAGGRAGTGCMSAVLLAIICGIIISLPQPETIEGKKCFIRFLYLMLFGGQCFTFYKFVIVM